MEVEISVCISINYSKIILKYYAHDFCSLNYPSENLGTNWYSGLAHRCTRLLYEKARWKSSVSWFDITPYSRHIWHSTHSAWKIVTPLFLPKILFWNFEMPTWIFKTKIWLFSLRTLHAAICTSPSHMVKNKQNIKKTR